jgi:UDP-glucose 4-epimerase
MPAGQKNNREQQEMRILVTGGAGFIGSHLVRHFQDTAEVRVLDNLRSGYLRNLDGFQVEFVEGSITDRDVVRQVMQGVDYVFHLAAMISVPESMEKPVECVGINTIGTLIVLEEAASAGVKKLSLSSSAAIYGNNPQVPKIESMIPKPQSPYAVSKLDGEYYCRLFTEGGRLDTVCLRYFNVFGPRQDPKSAYAAAAPIFIDSALQGEPLTIFGDGEQTRDFIYVKDVVAANAWMTTESTYTGVFNVAYGGSITIRDLADKIIIRTGSSSEIRHLGERPGDVKHSRAAVGKILATGFRIQGSLEQGLNDTIDYLTESDHKLSAAG